MKFDELKNRVVALDDNGNLYIQVRKYSDKTIIRTFFGGGEGTADLFFYEISEQRLGSFIELKDILLLSADHRLALQKLAYKYSRTPLDEREDEPKFRVRILPDDNESYLNQSSSEKNLYASNSENIPSDKTIFNKSEYDKLQQEYPEWLPKFDKNDPHFEIVEGEDDE